MNLTPDEIERAAKRLCYTNKWSWDDHTDRQKDAIRNIVIDLAAVIDMPHSEEAVSVFMLWMGDAESEN